MARRRRILRYFGYALLAGTGALLAFALYLDLRVTGEFEGRRFSLPARIYARPIELHAGLRLPQADIEAELRKLGYVQGERDAPGWYLSQRNEMEMVVRPFVFWDGQQPAKRLKVEFDSGGVRKVTDPEGRDVALARLEPLLIGGIYPAGNEDRILVRLNEVPPHLVHELVAVEDRNFFTHHGFDLRALARAAFRSATGRTEGGSTITQQLVKNFFLTPERTLR